MSRVQQYTHDKQRMNELSMVYYNNLLSLGPILLLAAGFGELPKLASQEALRNPEFLMVAGVGGVLGFMISFSSLWFMSRSSATVYSLTVRRCGTGFGGRGGGPWPAAVGRLARCSKGVWSPAVRRGSRCGRAGVLLSVVAWRVRRGR